jgi:hypothetical protein
MYKWEKWEGIRTRNFIAPKFPKNGFVLKITLYCQNPQWIPLSKLNNLLFKLPTAKSEIQLILKVILVFPKLTLAKLILPHIKSRHVTLPNVTSPHLTSPHLASTHLTSPHLTSPHLTSPHLTSPHLTSRRQLT